MLALKSNIFDEIKANFTLMDAIIRYVPIEKLTQRGNKITGICPLPGHSEKTPSWTGNLATNTWRCYGCNAYGDQVDLVAQALNMPLPDAVKLIASDLGITPYSPETRKAAKRAIRQRQQEKHREEFGREIIHSEYHRLCTLERSIYHIIQGIKDESDLDKAEVIAALQNREHLQDFLDRWLAADDVTRLQMALVSREVF